MTKKNNLKSATVNLEKILEYFRIQESLRPENLTKYYLCKEIFPYVFFYPKKYYTRGGLLEGNQAPGHSGLGTWAL